MKISVGADHRGVEIKASISQWLSDQGHDVADLGTHSTESCDYPDISHAVANSVAQGDTDRGILVCGSGIGVSIAANKVVGVRAAHVVDSHDAEMSRRHNNANVLCLSGDRINDKGTDYLNDILQTWTTMEFEGGRHQTRVDKIEIATTQGSCHQDSSHDG